MNSHKNAKLTARGREEMIRRMQAAPAAAVAAGFGVSLRTAGKWMTRFRQGGSEALADRSSRPEHCRSKLTERDFGCVLALRKNRLTAMRSLCGLAFAAARCFGPCASSIAHSLPVWKKNSLYSVINGNSRDRCSTRTLKSSAKLMGLDIEKQEPDKFIAAGRVGNIFMSA